MLTCYQRTDGTTRTRHIPDPTTAARTLTAARTIPEGAQWYPAATRHQLDHDMGGVLTVSRGLVLHVQEGNGDPWGWFNRPDVDASSHWWVSRGGDVVQYVPAGRVAWAQAGGNGNWHSVETEGRPNESLTPAQVAALAALYRWGSAWWGWPPTAAETPTGLGLGWHGMGGTAWGGHTGCPGTLRRNQRADILARAQAGATPPAPPPEDTMPTAADIADELERRVLAGMRLAEQPNAVPTPKLLKLSSSNPWEILGRLYFKVGGIEAPTLAGIVEQLTSLRTGLSLLVDQSHPAAAALAMTPGGTDDIETRLAGLPPAAAMRVAHAALVHAINGMTGGQPE